MLKIKFNCSIENIDGSFDNFFKILNNDRTYVFNIRSFHSINKEEFDACVDKQADVYASFVACAYEGMFSYWDYMEKYPNSTVEDYRVCVNVYLNYIYLHNCGHDQLIKEYEFLGEC